MMKRMAKGQFNMNDLKMQLEQMIKMGGMQGMMGMMPGMGKMAKQAEDAGIDDKVLKRQIALIQSMTKKERANPQILQASRKKRIAAGAGMEVSDLNKLLKMHRQMSDMMKKMGKMGKGGMLKQAMRGMFGKGGMPRRHGRGHGPQGAGSRRAQMGGKMPGGLPGLGGGMGLPPGLSGFGKKNQAAGPARPGTRDYPDFKATFASYRSRFMGGPLPMRRGLDALCRRDRALGNPRLWHVDDPRQGDRRTYGMAGGWQPAKWPEREIAWIIWPDAAATAIALEATDAARRYFYDTARLGRRGQLSRPQEPRQHPPGRTAWAGAKRTRAADHRRQRRGLSPPAPEKLRGTQLAHGIEMEIAHYADPLFKPKGWALD
jgi:hypothetical protein